VQITSERTPTVRVKICTWISGIVRTGWLSVVIGSKTRGKKAGKKFCEHYRQEANNAIKIRDKDGKIKADGDF
jgi:hypothetical protein